MIQICQKDKEKVYTAIRPGKIDDIILTMKRRGIHPLKWVFLFC